MAKWVLLNAAEDLEPNLLSIVVTRNKIDFLEGKSFPEFSTVLQQKWEIFGKRLMTFWFITVMMVFVLFQVYLSNLLDEIKDASNASKHQHNISYVLYIIAGSFLLLDTLFEYSLGVVRSQEELDNAGFTCPEKQHRQYPIDLFVADMPPWKLDAELRKIYDGNIPSTSIPSTDSSRSETIKSALKAMSNIVSKRHHYSDETKSNVSGKHDAGVTGTSHNCLATFCNTKSHEDETKLPRGWRKDTTNLFRQFMGYNYCPRSSLEICSATDRLNTNVTDGTLDVILENLPLDVILENLPERPQQLFSLLTVVKMLRHFVRCFLGVNDSRILYSHLWSIMMLLSGLFTHIYKVSDIGITFTALATLFMFLYILRFLLLIETLGVYLVMIIRMLSHDLTKWLSVAGLYLVAFAEAFVLIGAVLQPGVEADRYFLAQFKWILGNDETGGFESNPDLVARNPVLHKVAFILFVVFMMLLPICLVNMLTGIFAKTCDSYAEKAQAIHRHTSAAITLSTERVLYRLPIPVLWLLGFRSSLSFVLDTDIARSLLRKHAPPPSTYLFRHHWAAFHSVCPFWPSRSTFVNCRTGYPLDASKLSFHAEKNLHIYEVPFSFFCHDADSNVKELLRMNSPRAFWFIRTKIVPHLDKYMKKVNSRELTTRPRLSMYDASEEANDPAVQDNKKTEVDILLDDVHNLLQENFDRSVVDKVDKNLRSFSATVGPGQFIRHFLHRMCILLETEVVNGENYHLLTMDFNHRN
jgi:hypothetical protein